MRRLVLLMVMLLLGVCFPVSYPTRADTIDYDIPNGHFYTQAVAPKTPAGYGYAITDTGQDDRGQTIRFWSEFQRLSGVSALGYPSSQRFILDGFWTQATQRVLMQWRPELNRVVFVNVFDKLHDLGLDSQLQAKYQVPPQMNVDDSGKSFEQVVRERQKILDGNPAIRQAYFSVSDPLQLNGLPTSQIVNADNVFEIIRAQRVVIQYWKKDVPGIAYAGQVTFGLGGDIAKEFGLVPPQAATPIPSLGPKPPRPPEPPID